LVAAVGCGGFGSVEEACTQSIQLTNQTTPHQREREALQRVLRRIPVALWRLEAEF
jgi:hypothetical protein